MARKRKRGTSQSIDRLSFAPLDEIEALEARSEGMFELDGRTLGSPSEAPLSSMEAFLIAPEAPSGVSAEARVGVDIGGGGGAHKGGGIVVGSHGGASAAGVPATALPSTPTPSSGKPPISVQPIVPKPIAKK